MEGMLLFGVIFIIVSTFVAAALLQWLWNITLPDIFGFKTVRYWQAFRLLLIAQLLFGPAFLNFRSPGSGLAHQTMSGPDEGSGGHAQQAVAADRPKTGAG